MKFLQKLLLIVLLLPYVVHAQSVLNQLPNATTTGTTVGALMKQTGGNAVILATTDTTAIGVVVSETSGGTTAVTTGAANYASVGQVYCLMAAAPTIDHFVQISAANPGYCLDTGSATYPTSGLVVGQVIGTTAGPIASTYPIRLIMAQPGGGGGGGGFTIGNPVTGSTNNTSLYVDNTGKAQNSESLPFGVTTTQISMACPSNVCTPNLSGASSSNQFRQILAGATTIANATGSLVAQDFTLELIQPGTGGPYAVTWGTNYTWVAGSAPTINSAANSATLISCHVMSTTTTYQCYGPTASVANAASLAAPTAPSSTSAFLMQGFSGTDYGCSACSFTPRTGGTMRIEFQSTLTSTSGSLNVGIQCQISYGTGTAPTKNTTLTGTQLGTVAIYTIPVAYTAGDIHQPFPQTAIVTGLTPGTTYWVDDACESITTASVMGLTNVNVIIWEK